MITTDDSVNSANVIVTGFSRYLTEITTPEVTTEMTTFGYIDQEAADALYELADLAGLGFSSRRKRRSLEKAIVGFTADCAVEASKTDDEIESSVTSTIENSNADDFTAFDSDSFASGLSLSVFSQVEITSAPTITTSAATTVGWEDWSEWESCTLTCDSGTRIRTRTHGTLNNDESQIAACNTNPCRE